MFHGNNLTSERAGQLVWSHLQFSLNSGQTLILTGPNGVGKTTLLRTLAGLLPLSQGQLLWKEESITKNPEDHARRIHYLGHQDGLKLALTPLENLQFWGTMLGLKPSLSFFEELLSFWKIAELSQIPCQYLSAGQRRRLALSRLSLQFRPLWLLDEPSANLDASGLSLLIQMITQHQAAGGMIILSAHQPLPLPRARLWTLPNPSPQNKENPL